MVSATLKEATRASHAALEKLMITRIRSTNSTARYKNLLALFYGFYKPMEERIDNHIDHACVTDYTHRRKSAFILADMQQLQPSAAAAICSDLPHINSVPASLGALYVLEGSTLGGRIICRMLADSIGPQPAGQVSFSFFNGYGDSTETMWASFRRQLDNYTTDPVQHDEMVRAANDTFIKFKEWILQHD